MNFEVLFTKIKSLSKKFTEENQKEDAAVETNIPLAQS